MIAGSRFDSKSEIARQQRLQRDIADLQAQISTGRKVTIASDDPAAAARIAVIGVTQADNAVYAANMTSAAAVAALVDTSLAGLQTSFNRAKELMLRAANGTLNDGDRGALATELQGIADDVAAAATAKDASGQPLYAQGAALAVPIGRGVSVAPGESYDEVFGSVALANGGTASLAGILASAIAAARSGASGDVTASIGQLDAALGHINVAQSDAGVRAARIDAAGDRLASAKTDLADERSGLEDTDLTAAVATLQSKMTTLSAAQSVLAQLGRSTLFDKLN